MTLSRFSVVCLVMAPIGICGADLLVPESPSGPSLVESVAALAESRGVVVASDSPLRKAFERSGTETVDIALSAVAKRFGLAAVTRPGSLVLQRTYRTPTELMELELPEIRSCAESIARITSKLSADSDSVADIKQRIGFAASFSPEQKALLAAGPLSFSQLSPEQQQGWIRVNEFHAYGLLSSETSKIGEAFQKWPQARFTKMPHSEGIVLHALKYPSKRGFNGSDWISLDTEVKLGRGPLSFWQLSHQQLAVPTQYPLALRQPLSITARMYSLEELIREIQVKTEVQVQVPSYARKRKVVVAVTRGDTGSLLQALQDLYGWERLALKERKFALRLPQPGTATDPRDLGSKLASVIPPPLARALEADDVLRIRKGVILSEILGELKGIQPADWSDVAATDLTPSQQDRLGQIIALEAMGNAVDSWRKRSDAPAWLIQPQLGRFRWNGAETGRGLLTFEVKVDGRSSGWGWVVGSSSLEK